MLAMQIRPGRRGKSSWLHAIRRRLQMSATRRDVICGNGCSVRRLRLTRCGGGASTFPRRGNEVLGLVVLPAWHRIPLLGAPRTNITATHRITKCRGVDIGWLRAVASGWLSVQATDGGRGQAEVGQELGPLPGALHDLCPGAVLVELFRDHDCIARHDLKPANIAG